MATRLEIYKCNPCGNITEVLHGGVGELICCNIAMMLLKANSVDAANEKHVPIIEQTETGYLVKVGSVAHPMEDKHYIEWIDLVADDKVYRQFLQPGDTPEAFFTIDAKQVSAREYCNLHGLWRG